MTTTMTKLETAVFNAIQSDMDMYGEEHFSTATLKDIASETNLTKESVKGVLGSLIKKGLVYDDVRDGCPTVYIIKNYVYNETVREETQPVEEKTREQLIEEVARDTHQVAKKYGMDEKGMFEMMYKAVELTYGPIELNETTSIVIAITNIIKKG